MFKVGDLVIVGRLDEEYDIPERRQCLNIPTEIIEVSPVEGLYKISFDDGKHFWFEDELDPIELDNLFE